MTARAQVPPLATGDRLDGDDYLARYWAMPDTRAELIQGVVTVASPVSADHDITACTLVSWTGLYRAFTPGWRGCATARCGCGVV